MPPVGPSRNGESTSANLQEEPKTQGKHTRSKRKRSVSADNIQDEKVRKTYTTGSTNKAEQKSDKTHPIKNGIDADSDETVDEERYFPIAVVGIGCRMPGNVNCPQDFQKVLEDEINVIGEVPPDRWSLDKYWHPDPHNTGTHCNKRAGFCENVHDFDNQFWNINPREAANCDVMQRALLEVTQECLDDGGIPSESMPKDTGVYIGICLMDHGFTVIEDAKCMNAYTHTGTSHSITANRLSYVYDLRGPSVAIDTACAASLTSMHFACFGLWNKECPHAIVAASNTLMVPEVTVGFSALGVLAPDGMSCPFSANAKGYVRSEGTGAVYLKPLKDALADGDHVYCTIRASWLAHNGASLSITMPESTAQADMMKKTYQVFGLDINKTDVIEAHGTGTPVGDPIEAEGIAQAFTIGNTVRKKPLILGSSKSNFGHMEGAAGMVQIIKTALMLEKRTIFPQLNYGEPNPAIDLDAWKLRVPTVLEDFKENRLMRVGVNTFGFGGALAHMVFEEAKQKYPKQKNSGYAGWQFGKKTEQGLKIPIPLSAKSKAALKEMCLKWADFSSDEDAMVVTCWLATRRSHYANRLIIMAESGQDFMDKCHLFAEGKSHEDIIEGTLPSHGDKKKICFIYPGQGQQTFNMGRTLYRDEPIFQKAIKDCDAVYKKVSGKSFCHTYNMFIQLDPKNKYNTNIVDEVEVSQPAILFLQIGLFQLLDHWGVHPDVIVGHSFGEIAAAYSCGALGLPEAVIMQYHRAKLMRKMSGTGSMAAVRVGPAEGEALCQKYNDRGGKDAYVCVACVNAPQSITIAGPTDIIKEICQENEDNSKQLRVQCAYHSPHMDSICTDFINGLKGKMKDGTASRCDWYSTVRGRKMKKNEAADAQYFWENIRGCVQFLDAVKGIMQDFPDVVFVELASSSTLLSSLRSIAKDEEYTPTGMVPFGQRKQEARVAALHGLASLHKIGIDINWGNVLGNCGKWMRLPLYPWQHSTFRYEAEGMRQRRLDLEDCTYNGLHGVIKLEQQQFLKDHIIGGKLIFPRSGFVEYIIETQFKEDEQPALQNITFHTENLHIEEEVDLNGESPARTTLVMQDETVENSTHVCISANGTDYCTADKVAGVHADYQIFDIEMIKSRCGTEMSSEDFYDKLADIGVGYQDNMRFKAVDKFFLGDGESLAVLFQTENKRERIHTCVLDAAMTVALASQFQCMTLLTPISIQQITMSVCKLPYKDTLLVYAQLQHCDAMGLTADVHVLDKEGKSLVTITGLEVANVKGRLTNGVSLSQCMYTTEWQPIDSCMPPTHMVKQIFEEGNLRKEYPDEMRAIDKAEKHTESIKSICAAYARYAIDSTQQKDIHQKIERYSARLAEMASTSPSKLTLPEIGEAIEKIEKQCPAYHQEMKMIKCMGDILADTLKDPRGALGELFKEEMMGAYFIDSITVNIYYKAIADLVRKAVETSLQKKKIVRVMEIGGRLGGLSKYICASLQDLLEAGTVEYVFSDINITFFHLVQEKLKGFSNVRYQQLDIEKDIKSQGLVPNSMDLVVCLDTLHCTENAVEATRNMRDVLCRDGWSIVMESTNNNNTPEIIFGAFDLCWIFDGQDGRAGRCWASQATWSSVMEEAGFTDVLAVSTPNEFYHSLIVGRKLEMSLNYAKYQAEDREAMETNTDPCLWMLVHSKHKPLVEALKGQLGSYALDIPVTKLADSAAIAERHTGEVKMIYFWEETDSNLCELLEVLRSCPSIGQNKEVTLWVVLHTTELETQTPGVNSPLAAAAAGLVRTASNEVQNVKIYLVNLDERAISSQVTDILMLVNNQVHTDHEIAVRKGVQYVPRMIRQSPMKTLPNTEDPWVMQVAQCADDELDLFNLRRCIKPQPGSDEICIRVCAADIANVDLHSKAQNTATQLGQVCAGIVESVGDSVHNISVSSKVVAFVDDCVSTYVIAKAVHAFPKPVQHMTDAAGSTFAYASAYYSLVTCANLKENNTVLIISSHSAVDLACEELAKHIGAKFISCTLDAGNITVHYNGQRSVTYTAGSSKFYSDILDVTSGRGVDVVLDSVNSGSLSQSLKVLRHRGHLCQFANTTVTENRHISKIVFRKAISLHVIDMKALVRDDSETLSQIMSQVTTLLQNGHISPIPIHVSSITDIIGDVKSIRGAAHVVYIYDFIPALVSPANNIFNCNATYIITGSSGGVGLNFSRWMVQRGARHIVLVSKHGNTSWFQKSTVKYLKDHGANVYEFKADLTKQKEVMGLMKDIIGGGKPCIKGIFHMAGINEDGPFNSLEKMELRSQLSARLHSARLLHDVSVEHGLNLDHFVLFSSAAASYGNPGFAGLNASCCGLDGLARARRASGLAALSIQTGWIRGSGWLEDIDRSQTVLESVKDSTLNVNEFFTLLHRVLPREDLPPVLMIANEDWDSVVDKLSPDSLLCRHYTSASGKRRGGSDMSADDLEKKVVDKLGSLLMMAADEIDITQPMIHYGVDSLISLDITNWMRKEFNLQVNQMEVLEGLTTASLIEQALG